MASSEITHCLLRVDFFTQPEIFKMSAEERSIYAHCHLQGAKNNMGIFSEHRGSISFRLRTDQEVCYNFFTNNPDLIYFDEATHLIWVKKFYDNVIFGIEGSLYVNQKDKETKKIKEKISFRAIKTRNNFISKIKSTIKKDPLFRKNPKLIREWVSYNFDMLSRINSEVKLLKGNKYNLDELLTSY